MWPIPPKGWRDMDSYAGHLILFRALAREMGSDDPVSVANVLMREFASMQISRRTSGAVVRRCRELVA